MDINRVGNRRISYLTRTYTSDNWLEQIPEYVREAEPGWEKLWELTKDVNIFEMTPAQRRKAFICGLKPVGFFGTGNYQLFTEDALFQPTPGTTYRVRVLGAGSAGYQYGGSGGGYAERTITIDSQDPIQITVGQGGYVSSVSGESTAHLNGGTSSFGSYVSATGGTIYPVANRAGGTGIGGDFNSAGGASNGAGGASSGSDLGNGVGTPLYAFGGAGLQTIYPDTNNMWILGGGGIFTNYQKLADAIEDEDPHFWKIGSGASTWERFLRIAGGGGLMSAGDLDRATRASSLICANTGSSSSYVYIRYTQDFLQNLSYTETVLTSSANSTPFSKAYNMMLKHPMFYMQGNNCSDYEFDITLGGKVYNIRGTKTTFSTTHYNYSPALNYSSSSGTASISSTTPAPSEVVNVIMEIPKFGGLVEAIDITPADHYTHTNIYAGTQFHGYDFGRNRSFSTQLPGDFGGSAGVNSLITTTYGSYQNAPSYITSGFGAGNGLTVITSNDSAYILASTTPTFSVTNFNLASIKPVGGVRNPIGGGGGMLYAGGNITTAFNAEPTDDIKSLVPWGGGAGAFTGMGRANAGVRYACDASYGGGGGVSVGDSYAPYNHATQTYSTTGTAGGRGMVLVEW